jgi:Fe-S oxidoreductase
LELEEMPRNGRRGGCCAGGTWGNCDRYAKQIQVDRLREARATGAEVLVTACPKCQIHFRCAMKDPNLESEVEIEMRDVAELVASALTERESA